MDTKGTIQAPEPFVSAEEAATFLSINRRLLLSLARRGIAGAYALGTGESGTFGFYASPNSPPRSPQNCGTIRSGSPR